MIDACNPSILGGQGGWIMRSGVWDQLDQHDKTLSLLKIQKISWAWWFVPVISATWEADAGELLEPGRRSLRWAEIAALHSGLDKSEIPSQKQNKTKQNEKPEVSYHSGNVGHRNLFSSTLTLCTLAHYFTTVQVWAPLKSWMASVCSFSRDPNFVENRTSF